MLSTIYSALSGMLGFSKGLDVISNNIANLNTPGFKGSELEFRDLFYRYTQDGGAPDGARSQIGSGLETKGTRTRFRQGELRDERLVVDRFQRVLEPELRQQDLEEVVLSDHRVLRRVGGK